MKKRSTIILALFLVALVSAYLVLDKQLSYYGRNNFDWENEIPLKIKPIFGYDFEGGIYLADEYDMSIVTQGLNEYRNGDSINVKTIKRYGYSDSKVLAEVVTTKGQIAYIALSNDTHKPDFLSIIILKNILPLTGYTWVDLSNADMIRTTYVIRNWMFIFIAGVLVLQMMLLFKSRK